jgi:hypothetical protein
MDIIYDAAHFIPFYTKKKYTHLKRGEKFSIFKFVCKKKLAEKLVDGEMEIYMKKRIEYM